MGRGATEALAEFPCCAQTHAAPVPSHTAFSPSFTWETVLYQSLKSVLTPFLSEDLVSLSFFLLSTHFFSPPRKCFFWQLSCTDKSFPAGWDEAVTGMDCAGVRESRRRPEAPHGLEPPGHGVHIGLRVSAEGILVRWTTPQRAEGGGGLVRGPQGTQQQPHSPGWGAGPDHRASGPGESVGRGSPGPGLGGNLGRTRGPSCLGLRQSWALGTREKAVTNVPSSSPPCSVFSACVLTMCVRTNSALNFLPLRGHGQVSLASSWVLEATDFASCSGSSRAVFWASSHTPKRQD